MIRIAVANQKGGVGKTTTAVNLASALNKRGYRSLLVDLDPQGNATSGSGIQKQSLSQSVYEVLLGDAKIEDAIEVSPKGGFSVLPANRSLAGAEVELGDMEMREFRLQQALSDPSLPYDFCIIDCPPSLSFLTINALVAADFVLIPMQCEYYALEGLSDLVNTVKRIRERLNTNLRVAGIVRVMFDSRNMLAQQVAQQLEQHFGSKLFKTIVPRNIRLAEAPSHGTPGIDYDPQSRGAIAYEQCADELLIRLSSPAPTSNQP